MFRINSRGRLGARPATPQPPPPPPAAVPLPMPSAALPPAAPWPPAPARSTTSFSAGPVRVTPEQVRHLLLSGRMPAEVIVSGAVRLSGEHRLRELPTYLECTHLEVNDCPNLELLPERLRATSVQAARTNIREVTGDWLVREHLNLSENPRLNCLPERLTARSLDVGNCPQLHRLPEGLHLTKWIEVAGSGLLGVPSGFQATLRWQGASVDERTAFRPEELRASEILQVRNVTRRRVLLDRFGLDRFIKEVGGLVIDRDRDAGGERQLIVVPLEDDEAIHVLRVTCPSTAHLYILRVPPSVRTCRRAAAWLAGFEHERDYQPLIET